MPVGGRRLWQQPCIEGAGRLQGWRARAGWLLPHQTESGAGKEGGKIIGKCFGITITANLPCSGVQARACLHEGLLASSTQATPAHSQVPPPQVPELAQKRLCFFSGPPGLGGGGVGEQEGWMCLLPTSSQGIRVGFPPWNVNCG